MHIVVEKCVDTVLILPTIILGLLRLRVILHHNKNLLGFLSICILAQNIGQHFYF